MNVSIRNVLPRLPLDGHLDLTYRCNNNCRHCWLWLPANAPQRQKELTFEEIRDIVQQARAMGCQAWGISGGEPMLRPDFAEIFQYLTNNSISVLLNTNGTLITPKIARLLTLNVKNMVALYGATADTHDYVTRTPGSFEATMRGFTYLKEAGAHYTVQIVPMRANFHQYNEMIALAQSLSNDIRVGAAWLLLSADHSAARNREIKLQRLDPKEVLLIDKPGPTGDILNKSHSSETASHGSQCGSGIKNDYLFSTCIPSRRDFYIDPYAGMSFCYYIKDPTLRYDLRKGTFQEAWDEFIPSLTKAVRGNQEYLENCGSCELRKDCRWCAVFGYLEHGRYSAKVDYLCQVAAETRRYKENWRLNHIHYYQIAGITLQVSADLPITDETFAPKFTKFKVDKPGKDTITIKLVSAVPTLAELNLGREIYRRPPWAIYRQHNSFVYMGIASEDDHNDPHRLAIVNREHSQITIYRDNDLFNSKRLHSLTSFTSDQILLAPVLANYQACYMHSSGIIIDGQGLLFVGHSDAGKSTMLKMLKGQGEILCDDRNIIRRWPDGFRIHGTWSHGELPDVSPAGAPLRAILFLEQATTNEIIPVTEKQERLGKLLSHVIKALVTEDWWDKTLTLMGKISTEVPAYRLKFDKSGKVVDVIKELIQLNAAKPSQHIKFEH